MRKIQVILCEIAEGLWGLAGTVPGSRRAAEWGSDGVGLGEGVSEALFRASALLLPGGPRNSYLRVLLSGGAPSTAFDSPVHPTGSGAGSIQQEVTDP